MTPVNNPNSKLDQSESVEDGGDLQSPAPIRGGDGSGDCVYSIIDSDKLNPIAAAVDTHHPPSQGARNAAGFYLRWTIIVLNVALEMAQIILTLEASGGKIRGPTYRALTATTSSICLLLSAIEIAHATKSNGVVSKRRARRIGFAIWFGLVSSTVQFSVNVTALAVKKAVVNFDYLGLMFAVCYFFAAISGGRSGHVAVVKCVSHGISEAEGKFLEGMWVFECYQCTHDQIKLA